MNGSGIDTLVLLIALEQTRERGVEIHEGYYESKDVAAHAVLSEGADIGVGTPYRAIKRQRPPIRLVYQLNRMDFDPVIDAERYRTWADLDGREATVHSRGSGTEAIADLLAARHGIAYERINYFSGSEVRAGAMVASNIHATLLDRAGSRLLQAQGGERFRRMSLDGLHADEALYATVRAAPRGARTARGGPPDLARHRGLSRARRSPARPIRFDATPHP